MSDKFKILTEEFDNLNIKYDYLSSHIMISRGLTPSRELFMFEKVHNTNNINIFGVLENTGRKVPIRDIEMDMIIEFVNTKEFYFLKDYRDILTNNKIITE